MARLCILLAERWSTDTPLAEKFANWPGDIGPAAASLPLRLAGGLHALVLRQHDAALSAAYPPNTVDDDTLWQAVVAALHTHSTFLDHWTDNAPQTNEVRRSATLIGVGHWLAARYDLPFVLSELGASGGLNLMWDRFGLEIAGQHFGWQDATVQLSPDWTGPTPPKKTPQIAERRGVDLNPLDARNPDDALRLMAYLWADQPDRLARTRAAIDLYDATVDQADAIDWLAARLASPRRNQLHLIYHTVAWQYFPPSHQARGQAMIEHAGSLATPGAPLAWFGMENDGADKGAALTLRLWPGDISLNMGRADFHGRWVEWSAPS